MIFEILAILVMLAILSNLSVLVIPAILTIDVFQSITLKFGTHLWILLILSIFGDFDKIAADPLTDRPEHTLPPKCPNRKKYTSNIFHDQKGSTYALGCECWTNQELRCLFLAEEQMPQPISMDEDACFDLEEGLV